MKKYALAIITQGMISGANLLILPLMLIYLNKFDIGIWFIFLAISGINQLIEMGFQPVISRNISYVLSGAQFLKKNGSPGNIDKDKIRYELICLTFLAGKSIYKKITALSAAIALTIGTYYISTLITEKDNQSYYFLAWLIFAIGGLITLSNGLFIAYLTGNGLINRANYSLILNRVLFLALGGIGLVWGFGIFGLSISYLVASTLSGLYIRSEYNRFKVITAHNFVKSEVKELVKKFTYTSFKYGVAGVGSFLLQRGNVLVASSFLGAAGASSYALTNSILISVATIILGLSNTQMPIINQLAAAKRYSVINAKLKQTLGIGMVIYLFVFLIIFFYGAEFLIFLGSETKILSGVDFILFGIVMLLEINHSICSTFITSKNIVPFFKAGIYSGVLAIILSIIFIDKFGIIAIIIAQGLSQILYNNWKWPKIAFRMFKNGK